MTPIEYIAWLIAGLLLILVGANIVTDGASSIAKRFGVSDLTIGLTVVAFGTSAPELVISLMAACSGCSSIAIGNVVGSNIFNILVILGATSLVSPIIIKKSVMTNEIPMVILSSLILLALGFSSSLDGTATSSISRVNGLMLLVFFALFMRYMFASAKRANDSQNDDPARADGDKLTKLSMTRAAIYVVAGLAGLIWGGDKFVDGASGIARSMGVSDAIIGLTIVAIGTSLPELATSIVAAVKHKPGLAIGNVIGSNIFNILLILGAAASISPLPFGDVSKTDLLTLTGASILFLLFGRLFKQRTITRIEGAIMVACYAGYMAYLIATA